MKATKNKTPGTTLSPLFQPDDVERLWNSVVDGLERRFCEDCTNAEVLLFSPVSSEVVTVKKGGYVFYGFRRVELKTADGFTLKWSYVGDDDESKPFLVVIELNGAKIAEAKVGKDFGNVFWHFKPTNMRAVMRKHKNEGCEIRPSSYGVYQMMLADAIYRMEEEQ